MKGVIDALFGVACAEIKRNGNFKLAGSLHLKLKTKLATPAKKGINPFLFHHAAMADERHEGHEGPRREVWSADAEPGHRIRCGDQRLEEPRRTSR